MTKTLILIALMVLIYLYWKYQQNKTIAPKPEEIIERTSKQKETFWDAQDFDLNSDEEYHHSNHD